MKELLASSDPIAEPLATFDALPLSPEVRKAVDELGYTHPTPVQKAVFETAASGRDVVVQARTGTGKTAAFGLPIVDRLVRKDLRVPQVLVLCPTRELALQIAREMASLAAHNGITCTAIYGGAAMGPQISAIQAGSQIIVGTPGRVLDHLERGTLNPKTLGALVLDESDEMLSMGFLPQITRIMEQLPPRYQTLLFSATLPADVRRIAETRLTNPEFITLSGDHIGALSIDHFVYRSNGSKADELVRILEIENPESAIIFCNTRDQTKRLCAALTKKGFSADWLNADLAQNDREKVMKATRESKLRFLVCTDVAARGIDISHLTHVINADFPESTEAYVHRTGRTGRAGKTGTAISLVTPQDVGNLYMLRLTYKIFPIERELPTAGDLLTRKEADLVDYLYRAFSAHAQLPSDASLARRILTSDFAETIVAGLLRDHLGAHPRADDTAASLRRETPTAEEPKKKEKKGKKKGDKDKKKDKSARQRTEQEPLQSSEHALPPPASPSPEKRPGTPANDTDFSGLEVVSASALLTEGERAMLRGDTPPRRGPQPKERGEEPPSLTTRSPAKDAAPSARQAALQTGASAKGAPQAGTLEENTLQKSPLQMSALQKSTLPMNAAENDENLARVFVDAGKRDQIYKDDFLDALEDRGFDPKNVAFVSVRDTHTFIGVQPDLIEAAISALDGHEVGGLEVSAERARPKRTLRA